MSDDLELSKAEIKFMNNVAKPGFVPALFTDDKYTFDGYTHKDGTQVLLSKHFDYCDDDDLGYYALSGKEKVVLIKDKQYLLFDCNFDIDDIDHTISYDLDVSVGKLNGNKRKSVKLEGQSKVILEHAANWSISRVLKREAPTLFEEYNKYMPCKVYVPYFLNLLRNQQNAQPEDIRYRRDEPKVQPDKMLFRQMLDKWKIVK